LRWNPHEPKKKTETKQKWKRRGRAIKKQTEKRRKAKKNWNTKNAKMANKKKKKN
jgi:hypothetical protein